MDRNNVLKQINEIFIDVFDNGDIVLTFETAAKDVEDWDSLTHIHLVVAMEKKFKIQFTSSEIQNWKNVGEIVDSVLSKSA